MKKKCTKCGVEKLVSGFYHDKTRKDGYHSECKECASEYRTKNKERMKEYRRKNKDEMKDYNNEYRRRNKDKISKQKKEYYRTNKEKIKEFRRRNKEKTSKYDKEYRKTENGKLAYTRSNHNRRASYKKERADITPALWAKILESQNNKCNLCHKKFTKKRPATQDHIVSISQGGSLKSDNIQALCKSCNSSKQVNLDKHFIQSWTLV